MNEKLINLLYKSFDDKLTVDEQQQLNQALESSLALKEEKRKIEQLRQSISNTAENYFSPYFAERVMQKIATPATVKNNIWDEFFSSLLWSFRRIAIAGGVAVLLLLANNFISDGSVSIDSALSIKQVSIEDIWSFNDLIAETIK